MAVRIITDSTSDMPAEKAKVRRVTVVPLTIQFGPASYYDGKTITNDLFYKMLTQGQYHPTTAQPSPEAFLHHFEKAREVGDEVVCITLASALSGTHQSACIARDLCDEYEEHIHIVDSETASGGMQILINYACKLRDCGLGAADIAKAIEALKPRIHIFAIVDTLEYLRKGGRLSTAQAVLGTVSKLKPVLFVHQAKIGVCAKAFGSSAALKQLVKQLAAQPVDDDFPSYFLYSDDIGRKDAFLTALQSANLLPRRLHDCGLGATLGTHVGPGACGIAYVAAE